MESTVAVSVRLPKDVVKMLRKKKDYTVWIKQVILDQLGVCPVCTGRVDGIKCHEPKKNK